MIGSPGAVASTRAAERGCFAQASAVSAVSAEIPAIAIIAGSLQRRLVDCVIVHSVLVVAHPT